MRTRWIVLVLVAVFCGALGGSLLAPQPAGAVSKEMIELQQTVSQILQAQQDLRSTVDGNNAAIRTLVQQSLDSVNRLSGQMSAVQKSVQEVQANTGSRIDTMTQQTQGLSDNLQDVQARVGKLSQQLTDMQNLLQSIDARVSGGSTIGTPAAAPGGNSGEVAPPSSPVAPNRAPISADTLYQNGLRDLTSGKYDLARQEFSDYIQNFPSNDLAGNVATLSIPIQRQVATLDPELAVYDVLTLDQILSKSTTNQSFSATLVLGFAVLSLLLAAIGLYGVLSYLVSQRIMEIGIRIALGAQRSEVLRLVLFDGLRPVLFGLVIGLAGGAAAATFIRSILYGTSPLDPLVLLTMVCCLLVTALAACALPAIRASRIEPMQALRTE